MGCSLSEADISPEGQLEIFGPSNSFSAENFPDDWVLEGIEYEELSSYALITKNYGGTLVLRLMSFDKSFIILRRTKANLLASPFLGWSWNVSPTSGQAGAISIIVGFFGGAPTSRSWIIEPFANLGKKVPPYDRAISIVWGADSEIKGNIEKNNKLPRYIVRAGTKDTETWLNENLDLSNLYRQVWPEDNVVRARITFVGFTSVSTAVPTTAKFGDVVLYR